MPTDPFSKFSWGAPIGRSRAHAEAFAALRREGRFFLTTDLDGRSLEGHGSRLLLNYIQQTVWQEMVQPSARRGHTLGTSSPQEGVQAVRVSWSKTKRVVEANPGFPAMVVTREKLDRRDFTPEDIVDVHSMKLPLLEGRPASFMYFLQRDNMRAILANLRPEHNPDWTIWPTEETEWMLSAFGDLTPVFQFGHLPKLIENMNEHGIAFALGVKPAKMAKAIEAARHGTGVDEALESAFANYNWEEVFDEWQMNPAWKRRMPIFLDALKCLRADAPGGTVVQLLAQIEGVVMEYLQQFNDGVGKDGKMLAWTKRRENLEIRLRADERLGPVRRATVDPLLSFLDNSGLYEPFYWHQTQNRLGRHSVLHGQSVDYISHANAIRALLALDALYWVTGFQGRQKPLDFVDPTPGVPATIPDSGEVWTIADRARRAELT